jgi:hypothetical protein
MQPQQQQRPANVKVKAAALIVFAVGSIIAFMGFTTLAGLCGLAVFVLIFFI